MTDSQILDEIRSSKEELKSAIEAVEVRIALKLEEANRRLFELEKENNILKTKIEEQDRKIRKNNIVIFGLKHLEENITANFVTCEIRKLFGVEINEIELKNFYTLGKSTTSPILVEFVSFLKKKEILMNAKKLKGTKISVANDLTIKQRQDYTILKRHLHLAKLDKNKNCFIKKFRLHVGNKIYSVEDLEEANDTEKIAHQPKNNSAPGTPTTSYQGTQKELPRNKPITSSLETRKQKLLSNSSPAAQGTDTIKQVNTKKETEDKTKVETRSNKALKKKGEITDLKIQSSRHIFM